MRQVKFNRFLSADSLSFALQVGVSKRVEEEEDVKKSPRLALSKVPSPDDQIKGWGSRGSGF